MLEYLRYFNLVIAPYAFAVVVVFVVVVVVYFSAFPVKMLFCPFEEFAICVILTL